MILVHELTAICRNGWKYTRDHLTHRHLSNEAYDICAVIYTNDLCNQDTVVKALKMDKSSVAKIIRKCEKEGIIFRMKDQKDMRNYCLSLTEEGKEIICNLIDTVALWQKEALSCLSEEEIADFTRMVEKIRENTRILNK